MRGSGRLYLVWADVVVVVVGMGVSAIQWVVVEGVEVVPVGETWRWLTEYTAGVTQPSFRRAPSFPPLPRHCTPLPPHISLVSHDKG